MQQRQVWNSCFTVLVGAGAFWALPSYAGVVTTAQAAYVLDDPWPSSETVSAPDGHFALEAAGAKTSVGLYGDDSGFSAGAGARGFGSASASVTATWKTVLTNSSAVAQHYTYTFVISGASLAVQKGDNAVGTGLASYGVNVSRVGMGGLYSTSASLNQSGALIQSGASLSGGNLTPVIASSVGERGYMYAWDASTVVLDLGILAPSETLELDYELTYAASVDFDWIDGGPFDYVSAYGGSANVSFGDPGVFNGAPAAINVVSSAGTIPEPTSLALLATGLPLLWARRRRVMPF